MGLSNFKLKINGYEVGESASGKVMRPSCHEKSVMARAIQANQIAIRKIQFGIDVAEVVKSMGFTIGMLEFLVSSGVVSRMVVIEEMTSNSVRLYVPKKSVKKMDEICRLTAPLFVNWSVMPLNCPMKKRVMACKIINPSSVHDVKIDARFV